MMRSLLRVALVGVSLSLPVLAEEFEWPQPLSLQQALVMVDETHPNLLLAQARIRQAEAEQSISSSAQALQAQIDARVRWIEPSNNALLDDRDDHRLGLTVSKQLWDGGRTDALTEAGEARVQSESWGLWEARQAQKLVVMQAFFAVILADMEFTFRRELMASDFILFDRTKERHALGQKSDVDLLEAEAAYQASRKRYYQAEVRQRLTRSRLAIALNHPGQLPADLQPPEWSSLQRKGLDEFQITEQALITNRRLLALQAQLEAARAEVTAARGGDNPLISGVLTVADHSRDLGGRDKAQLGVELVWPLSSGGRVDAEVARAEAEVTRVQALLMQERLKVEQEVLDVWLELEVLKARREELIIVRDFRELKLDQSRALYELEAEADLGDAMGAIAELDFERAQYRFDRARLWAQLNILMGEELTSSWQWESP